MTTAVESPSTPMLPHQAILPCPLTVTADDSGIPVSVKIQGYDISVREVVDSWAITGDWNQERISTRMHYDCLMSKSLRITVFQDMDSGLWYW